MGTNVKISEQQNPKCEQKVVSRDERVAARFRLFNEEKELTRRSDELARRRQELPWVRIDKEYQFETDGGSASLADLFKSRSQLLIYHFMFGPDYTAGSPSFSAIADGFDGSVVHLANDDVTLMVVSRAPLAMGEVVVEDLSNGQIHRGADGIELIARNTPLTCHLSYC